MFRRVLSDRGALRARGGGTGLGLSLTRNFLELHHGRLGVKSKPSEVWTFPPYLPVDFKEVSKAAPRLDQK